MVMMSNEWARARWSSSAGCALGLWGGTYLPTSLISCKYGRTSIARKWNTEPSSVNSRSTKLLYHCCSTLHIFMELERHQKYLDNLIALKMRLNWRPPWLSINRQVMRYGVTIDHGNPSKSSIMRLNCVLFNLKKLAQLNSNTDKSYKSSRIEKSIR